MANLDWFKIFLAVADSGSITRASENLYISQPAVTKCIKQLEKDLDAPLFVRKHSGVELSEYGKAIYKQAKQSIKTLDSFGTIIGDVKNGLNGELKIATTTSNAGQLLAEPILQFCKKYPNIKLRIIRINEENMLRDADSFDFIFCDSESAPKTAESVFDYAVCYKFVCGKGQNIKSISTSNLKDFNFVLINKTYTSRTNIDNYFRSLGTELLAKYEVDNYATAIKLVKSGLGVGIFNPDYFENEISSGEIKIIDSSISISPRHLSLIKQKNAVQSFAATEFEKLLSTK